MCCFWVVKNGYSVPERPPEALDCARGKAGWEILGAQAVGEESSFNFCFSATRGTRTPYLLLRRQLLCPGELVSPAFISIIQKNTACWKASSGKLRVKAFMQHSQPLTMFPMAYNGYTSMSPYCPKFSKDTRMPFEICFSCIKRRRLCILPWVPDLTSMGIMLEPF